MAKKWKTIIDENCSTIESEILGFPFIYHGLLVRALVRKDAYGHKDFPSDFKSAGFQNGLDTFGDKVLDFAIYDHFIDIFLSYENINKKKIRGIINGYREWYSRNDILEDFSLHCIGLHKYVIWGTNEFDKEIWTQSRTKILADSFEALVGAVYKDQGLPGVRKMLENTGYYEKIDQLRFQKGQKKSDFRMTESG